MKNTNRFLTIILICAVFISLIPCSTSFATTESLTETACSSVTEAITKDESKTDIPSTAAEKVTGYEQKLSDMAKNIDACIIYDITEDKLVFSKNSTKKISIASTTKLITSLVALQNAGPEDIFTVGTELNLVHSNSSLCYIQKGHQLKLKTLIAGMMLPSGNDAAYTVAVNIAKKHSGNTEMTDAEATEYFCGLMNEYAASLGCTGTHFVNPDGWDDPEHYSTADDMLIITKEALKNSTLTSVVSTYSRRFYFASGENIVWTSSNSLVNPSSKYYYAFANGIKTGTTDDAGKCLIASAMKAGKQLVILAYNCTDVITKVDGKEITDETRFSKVKEMFEFVFNAPVKGDVDISGDITAADARLVLRASVGLEEKTAILLERGDADNNGKITASDARTILRASVGLERIK